MTITTGGNKRTEYPYPPYSRQAYHSTAVMSVELNENEEVEWMWYGDTVIGYTIRRKCKLLLPVGNDAQR